MRNKARTRHSILSSTATVQEMNIQSKPEQAKLIARFHKNVYMCELSSSQLCRRTCMEFRSFLISRGSHHRVKLKATGG